MWGYFVMFLGGCVVGAGLMLVGLAIEKKALDEFDNLPY